VSNDKQVVSKPNPSGGGLTSTQKFILAVFGLMLVFSVLSVIGLSVLNSQQHATGAATPNPKCTRLEVGASPSPGGAVFTPAFVESDFFGCQTVGMNENAALALLHLHNVVVRIATRDGISFPLTADYSDGRVNLTVLHSVVTAYEVG
jgi:hypothetical protein